MERVMTWKQQMALVNLGEGEEDALNDEEMARWYQKNSHLYSKKQSKKERKNAKQKRKNQRKNAKQIIKIGVDKENVMAYAFTIEDLHPDMGLFTNYELKEQFNNVLMDNIQAGYYWEDIINSLDITDRHKAAIIEYYRNGIQQIQQERSPKRGRGRSSRRPRPRRRVRKKTKRRY